MLSLVCCQWWGYLTQGTPLGDCCFLCNRCLYTQLHRSIANRRVVFCFINFYWVIVTLQCCVHFCYTAKWISYTHTYIPSFGFPSQLGHHRALTRDPCTIQYARSFFFFESHSIVSDSLWPHGLYSPWNCPDQNTGEGSLSLLQGIFPTQGWNPGLPYCRQILYQLNHKGSPRILEWVAYIFSRGLSLPRNWTVVSCITGGFFTNWAIRELSVLYIVSIVYAHQSQFSSSSCPSR